MSAADDPGARLVTLASFATGLAAHVARDALEDAGIRALVVGENAATLGNVGAQVQILVRADGLERARLVLHDLEHPDGPPAEAPPPPSIVPAHPPDGPVAPPESPKDTLAPVVAAVETGCACWTCFEVATVCGPAVLLAVFGSLAAAGLWLGGLGTATLALGWVARRG